jgi:hypothetical protein
MSKIDPAIKPDTDNTPVCFHFIDAFLLSQRAIKKTKKFLVDKLIHTSIQKKKQSIYQKTLLMTSIFHQNAEINELWE